MSRPKKGPLSYQSRHSILTVSPSLMVAAKGTVCVSVLATATMHNSRVGSGSLGLTVGMPSVLVAVSPVQSHEILHHPKPSTYMEIRLLRRRRVEVDLADGPDPSFAHPVFSFVWKSSQHLNNASQQ